METEEKEKVNTNSNNNSSNVDQTQDQASSFQVMAPKNNSLEYSKRLEDVNNTTTNNQQKPVAVYESRIINKPKHKPIHRRLNTHTQNKINSK